MEFKTRTTNATTGLPMLKPGPPSAASGKQDFSNWQRAMDSIVQEKYGTAIARVISEEVEPAYAILAYPPGAGEAAKKVVDLRNANTVKDEHKFKDDSGRCIGFLEQHMSADSISRTKRHHEYNQVDAVPGQRSLLAYIQAVRWSHESAAGGEATSLASRVLAFDNTRQQPNEQIEVFYDRFVNMKTQAENVGFELSTDHIYQVTKFYGQLDHARHPEYNQWLQDYIADYKPADDDEKSLDDFVDHLHRRTSAAALATQWKIQAPGRERGGKLDEKAYLNDTNRTVKKCDICFKETPNNQGRYSSHSTSEHDDRNMRRHASPSKRETEQQPGGKPKRSDNKAKDDEAHVAEGDRGDQGNESPGTWEDGFVCDIDVSPSVIALVSTTTRTPGLITIVRDDACTRTVLRDLDLFVGELTAIDQVNIRGIQRDRPVPVTQEGYTMFGTALYCKEMPYNLLSHSNAYDQGLYTRYNPSGSNPPEDVYEMQDVQGQYHRFARLGPVAPRLYTMQVTPDLAKEIASSDVLLC